MAHLAIALFGATRITLDGRAVAGLGVKGRALLAYLALHTEQPQPRAVIADLLWPKAENPRSSLRVELVRIHNALGQPVITALPGELIQLAADLDLWLDTAEFTTLLDAVAAHADPDDRPCAACVGKLARAAGLYGGMLLAEIDHRPELEGLLESIQQQRTQLELQASSTLGRLFADAERRGEDAAAARYAHRALAIEPADEVAHCCLIRLLLRQSQFNDAAIQYELCRTALAELDAEPGAEAAELFKQIMQRRRAPTPAPPPRPTRVRHARATPTIGNHDRALMLSRTPASRQLDLLAGQAAPQLIELDLVYTPGALAAPQNLAARSRPPTTSPQIAALFDAAGGELLILGAPGAGKTTLLLLLAHALLARARADAQQPIPVVFMLSSWVQSRPLAEWCGEQLGLIFGVQPGVGQAWIAARYVLPLFDCLDEVRAEDRAACVAAINQFRQEYGPIRLAVCCRAAQYEQLGVRFALAEAVEVQPLTPRQIDQALAAAPRRLAGVRAVIGADPALQQIVATPLMLRFLEEAHERINLRALPQLDSAERQRYLSAAYVQCQLEAHQHRPARYRAPAITHRLSWLAGRMQALHESLFFLDHLSPQWLATACQRAIYTAAEKLAFGLIVGLVSGVIWSLDGGLNRATLATPLRLLAFGRATPATLPELSALLRTALGATLLIGVVMALAVWLSTWLLIERRGAPSDPRRHLRTALVIGCTVGVLDGLLAGRWNGLVVFSDSSLQLLANLGLGLLTGLAAGLGAGFTYWRAVEPGRVLIVERFHPPGAAVWRWLKRGILVGILLGAIYGLAVGASEGVLVGLLYGMALGLANGVVAGLLCGFLIGIERDKLAKRMVPNQGIRLSAAAALRSGSLAWLVVSLTAVTADVLALIYFFGAGRPIGLLDLRWIGLWSSITWSIWALSFGAGAALVNGGFACIQHLLLRTILWITGAMPWRCVHLLDEAVACNLLVRVGGGYHFTHELIQQHFASQTPPNTTDDPPEPPLLERTV